MGGCASTESKSPETAEDKRGGTGSIHTIPMDERRRFFIKIVMLMRVDMRELFGMEVANRWGFWVDRYLSKQVRDFADWIQYPKGDHVLEGCDSHVYAAVVSDDGYLLFMGDEMGIIRIWNMIDNGWIRDWVALRGPVYSLAFQSGLLVSGSTDKSIKIWDTLSDDQLVHTLEGHTDWVDSVDINNKATEVISGSYDKSIRIWSVKTGECIRVLMGHSKWVTSVQFIGNLIVSGSHDKSLKVWNPSDGTEIKSVNEGIDNRIYDLKINSDASLVACAFRGGFSLFSWPEMKFIRMVNTNTYCCTFHPIHPTVMAVSYLGRLSFEILDLTNDNVFSSLEGHSQLISNLCFTPDGSRLVSVSSDTSVRIWDVSEIEMSVKSN